MRACTLTERFVAAFQEAFRLHAGQTRKGSGTPYIGHLLAVAALVIEHGGDEDCAIAALLHDAVEDQGGMPTAEDIRRKFGERVYEMVLACSDSVGELSDVEKRANYVARKQAYIAGIAHKNADARLVSTADKLHNVRAILADYREMGEKLWSRFNGGRKARWYQRAVADAFLAAQHPDDPPGLRVLTAEFVRNVEQLERLCAATETASR